MEENQVKECPYCRETIMAEAVRCRYCKSELPQEDQRRPAGCRDIPGRMLAGVAAYLAEVTGISVSVVRLAFIIGALFAFPAAVAIYAGVWILVPFRPEDTTVFERLMVEGRRLAEKFAKSWRNRAAERRQNEEHVYPVSVDTVVDPPNGHS